MEDRRLFTRDSIGNTTGWVRYRKRVDTPARRIHGPFVVVTREGPVECADGWLAVDTDGWPYPVQRDEFDVTYEPADRADQAGGTSPIRGLGTGPDKERVAAEPPSKVGRSVKHDVVDRHETPRSRQSFRRQSPQERSDG